jgi:hypothetical protein
MELSEKDYEMIYLDERVDLSNTCFFECYGDHIFTYHMELNNGQNYEINIIPTDKCSNFVYDEELHDLLGMEFDFLQIRVFGEFLNDGEILIQQRLK